MEEWAENDQKISFQASSGVEDSVKYPWRREKNVLPIDLLEVSILVSVEWESEAKKKSVMNILAELVDVCIFELYYEWSL